MQSLLLKQCFHSLEVSLPLLPSFDMRSGLGVEEVVVVKVSPLTFGKALESPEYVEDVVGVLLDLEGGVANSFAWWLISDLCFQ